MQPWTLYDLISECCTVIVGAQLLIYAGKQFARPGKLGLWIERDH